MGVQVNVLIFVVDTARELYSTLFAHSRENASQNCIEGFELQVKTEENTRTALSALIRK